MLCRPGIHPDFKLNPENKVGLLLYLDGKEFLRKIHNTCIGEVVQEIKRLYYMLTS
jgi:hypothetical protein